MDLVHLTALAALAATDNRITEVFKISLKKWFGKKLDDDTRKFFTLLFSLLAGIVVVYFTDVPIDLPFGQHWPEPALVVFSGLVVGLGSNFVHLLEDIIKALAPRIEGKGSA